MLTLGNDLKGLVSREVDAANRKTTTLGKSLTTGLDHSVAVVDAFLGNSLRDGEIAVNSITRSLSYSVNMLNVGDEYLKVIAGLTQECIEVILAASGKDGTKIAILQSALNDKKAQINRFINSANFDNKYLLNGSVRDLNVQVGQTSTDVIELNIINIGDGKLFRSSTAQAYNEYLRNNFVLTQYYTTQDQINIDYRENKNLLQLAEGEAPYAGSGTGPIPPWIQVATAWRAVLDNTPKYATALNEAAPQTLAALKNIAPADPTRDFSNATPAQMSGAFAMFGANYLPEIKRVIYDNQPLVLNTEQDQIVALDIMKGAVETLRRAQASISNQKTNVLEISHTLRAIINVTQQSADSYLKVDYVSAAQRYSETIRIMVAAITALQAANKIPEAAQKLLDNLAT